MPRAAEFDAQALGFVRRWRWLALLLVPGGVMAMNRFYTPRADTAAIVTAEARRDSLLSQLVGDVGALVRAECVSLSPERVALVGLRCSVVPLVAPDHTGVTQAGGSR